MYIFFLPLIFLPLIEIFSFVKISSALGLGWAFLWLIAATSLGFSILRARGDGAWSRMQKHTDDVFVVSDLFEGFCITLGAVLLIFPGFISDFIAIPFLIGPLRRLLFDKIKRNPKSFMRRHAKSGDFDAPRPGKNAAGGNPVIDGEFRKIDNNDHLTSQQ